MRVEVSGAEGGCWRDRGGGMKEEVDGRDW